MKIQNVGTNPHVYASQKDHSPLTMQPGDTIEVLASYPAVVQVLHLLYPTRFTLVDSSPVKGSK